MKTNEYSIKSVHIPENETKKEPKTSVNIQDSQASLPDVSWLTIAYMWDVDWEPFVESSS